jgi:hypothetical protein
VRSIAPVPAGRRLAMDFGDAIQHVHPPELRNVGTLQLPDESGQRLMRIERPPEFQFAGRADAGALPVPVLYLHQGFLAFLAD